MRVVTASEMRAIDKTAIEGYGIPSLILMEHAGLAVARRSWRELVATRSRKAVVFAGTGNNGGDGVVAARHLSNWGARVKVFLAGDPERVSKDMAVQLAMARRLGIEVVPLREDTESRARLNAATADLVIDALLGTGSRGAPRGLVALAIDIINGAGRPVVAVDIPSGIDADTGAAPGPVVQATWTVTLGLPKVGLLLPPGRELAGHLVVADIGLPRALVTESPVPAAEAEAPPADEKRIPADQPAPGGDPEGPALTVRVEPGLVRALLPPRPPTGHKGTFGHVLVVGGARGMSGAPMLAARGAQRVGAGLVTLAGPAALVPVFAGAIMEALTRPLSEMLDGGLAPEAAAEVLQALARADVLVIGPGMSRTEAVGQVVRRVLEAAERPVVADADALYALGEGARFLERIRERRFPLVLTPHPGEMARLCAATVKDVLANPLAIARDRARAWGAVVVLKGSPTIVAAPDGRAYINSTGSSALGTGGTGDVLAGAIGGLLAQGADPLAAAVAGVYVHGLAGDLAAAARGPAGIVAGDVADSLPQALARARDGQGPMLDMEG
ncbi:MAG TPA: NAD(P)H-hydrate dehydratase [Limnochordales bacterium]